MTESILRLVPPDNDPLADLASKIRDKLNLANGFAVKHYNARLAAGRLLCEAQYLCQQRGEPWEAWCKEHVWNHTLRDVRKIMAMAGAPDPEAAHQAEKEATRKRITAHRSHVGPVLHQLSADHRSTVLTDISGETGHVRPVSQELPVDLATIQAAVAALSIEDFAAFKTWFFGYCGRS